MNYRQIEIFATIMECASITEAANRLHLSQPAVSKSLKLLEDELGLSLFQRTPGGLLATDEARELYAEASRVLMGFTHLRGFAHNLQRLEHARLVISSMPALSVNWLPEVSSGFIETYPEVSLVFYSRGSAETVKLVAQGEIDIGISQCLSDDVSVRRHKLFDLVAVCAVPRTHPLAEREIIRPEDLNQQALILPYAKDEYRRILEATLLNHGVNVRSRLEVSLGTMMCSMVDAGCGIGIVAAEAARNREWPNLVFRRFEPEIRTPIYVMHNTHKPLSLVMQRFFEHIMRRAPRPLPEILTSVSGQHLPENRKVTKGTI